MAYPLPKMAMPMTSDEFLAWESHDDKRHQLIDGEVIVMESGSEGHQTVAANIYVQLRQHLRGTACKTLMALDVRCDAANCLVPDVLVYCDRDRRPRGMEQCPLIVEVLSPSTASYDRNGKFAVYRRLAALREYMVVDWKRRTTEVHRLDVHGAWSVARYSGDDVIHLASIDLRLAGALVFEGLGDAA
ncbi:Uma2 family endonuclease [Roseateles sp. MS654]|uniref:Uma2 family endonuclease n=1 Tax=Roseateles sp. MS654 TaxID=3412685 RepID=UPI003C2BEFFF